MHVLDIEDADLVVSTHDPRDVRAMLVDELAQRRESGYDTTSVEADVVALTPGDAVGAAALERAMHELPVAADWKFEEPMGRRALLAALPTVDEAPASLPPRYDEQVLGAWLGRIAGCNLGKPVEEGIHWTRPHLRSYLEQADAWPLLDYIPALDPLPTRFELHPSWPDTTRGRIAGSARDDDIDYTILALHMLEERGSALTPAVVAQQWLDLLPFGQVYTAERVVYANLIAGVPVADAATHRNPYREWIGALIRADAYGYVLPGRPRAAALLAERDASLSHVGNGLYGAMWAAALVAAAFTCDGVPDAVRESLRHVPAGSRLHRAVTDVLELHQRGGTWEQALDQAEASWGAYGWVHTVNNAAVITAGILWGDGDYARTVGLTVQGALDTDSNAATAGSFCGAMRGAPALPANFIEPLRNITRSALFGFDNLAISELAERTAVVGRRLAAQAGVS